jgi:hypothetical protein
MQVKERVRKEEEAAASAENVEQLKKTLQEVEIKGTSSIFIYIEISAVGPDPDWMRIRGCPQIYIRIRESGSGSRMAKMTHKNRKKVNKFLFLALDVFF